jgi:hypothetical protein
MEYDHYDFVPPQQTEKIVASAKAHQLGLEDEDE